ncbi:hypothetical protein NKY39_12120 [Sinorhizobium meliloti]|uniref:hypothetical protein n=1 Tax=Rhizobium meliloti TaxID=382 RepID=UPI003D6612EA
MAEEGATRYEEAEPEGLASALSYPLFDAIFNRRSRRISVGIGSVPAGDLSYSSDKPPQPLSELEEALLIAVTGLTGTTMPDMPFKDPAGGDLFGTPMLFVRGRAAASPDNAQGTSFIMTNDDGTYLIKSTTIDASKLEGATRAEALIECARQAKVKLLEKRLDFPREVPAFFGRNRYVSNLPGTTVFIPIVDLTRQYINGLLFLLSQKDGSRPYFIDDWSFYRAAGCKKWMKSGFLNRNIKVPLGMVGTMRIPIEADLLLQNLFLALEAMGLGGWIHAAPLGPVLLGAKEFRDFGPGLGFRFDKPRKFLRKLLIPITPMPAWCDNPVGIDGVLEGCCPPYYRDMNEAVDAVLASKYGPDGVYSDRESFSDVFKGGQEDVFLAQAPHVRADVVQCTKDICNYIYRTYGRFPAHVDAFFVPGVCLQAHHLDLDYYDQLFRKAYTEQHRCHDARWHADS